MHGVSLSNSHIHGNLLMHDEMRGIREEGKIVISNNPFSSLP